MGAAGGAAAVVVIAVVAVVALQPASDTSAGGTLGDPVSARTAVYAPPSEEQLAALPEARYDAVIPGLIGYASAEVPQASHEVYTISSDTAIHDDRRRPVARFAFQNFAGRPTVIVPVRIEGPWALVMTPARQHLPSKVHGTAPAQTAGWVRTDALRRSTALDRRVVISTGQHTLRIEDFAGRPMQEFDVGVGMPETPTPTGVTGYLQERYLDTGQGQATYPIQLTSLHSSAQDEPYQGEDGGLIGMHYFPTHSGSISHGCIRLSAEAITAVDALPLGTSVTIVP